MWPDGSMLYPSSQIEDVAGAKFRQQRAIFEHKLPKMTHVASLVLSSSESVVAKSIDGDPGGDGASAARRVLHSEREFCIDNLLVRIHLII
jgi:hypothetical protein